MGGSEWMARALAMVPPEEDKVGDDGGVGGWFSFDEELRGE